MSEYTPPLDDMEFVLRHVSDLERISNLNGFQHADPDTAVGVLAEAGRFFSEVIAPTNWVGDQQGSVLNDDGTVTTPEGFKEAYEKFVAAGWPGVHLPEVAGGGGFPYAVGQHGVLARSPADPGRDRRPHRAWLARTAGDLPREAGNG